MTKSRVLLVDDEPDFVAFLAKRLRTRGLEVETVGDGFAALEAVEGQIFDAVVLDLAMPGIDGIETLKRLLKKRKDLQVIMLTGHGSVAHGVEAMKLGAMDFLQKPAEIDDLMEKIKDAATNRLLLSEQKTLEEVNDILSKRGW